MIPLRAAVSLVVAGVVAGCSSSGPSSSLSTPASRSGSSTTASAGSTAAAASTPGSGPAATPRPHSVAARCGLSSGGSVPVVTWRGPGGSSIPSVTTGRGRVTAVFLHQTDAQGFCGWWPFASWLTRHYPVRAVLVDLCDYGQAKCPGESFSTDQLAQVAFAVSQARRAASGRLVLVGASMGGALAFAAATRVRADAVVDLSGPPDWPGALSAAAAAKLRVPLLVACTPGDPSSNYDALRQVFAAAPATPKKFVVGDGGHGWSLLNSTGADSDWLPLATTTARWIVGRYT